MSQLGCSKVKMQTKQAFRVCWPWRAVLHQAFEWFRSYYAASQPIAQKICGLRNLSLGKSETFGRKSAH
jgi:hypothetical protein